VKEKYALIATHRDTYPITLMCAALAVTPSGFYAAQHRPPSARAQDDERLLVGVRAAHAKSRRRYGAPRVHRELMAQGERVSEKRVARLMRTDGLVARATRRFIRTTDGTHDDPIAPNLLARQFAIEAHALNAAWVSDITYVPTREGWLFLAAVLDLASRRVVGWAMDETLETRLPLAALRMAIGQRGDVTNTIHHSDRGSQYASADYRRCLRAHGLRQSMSRKGDCWDAVAESFFATLEHELLAAADFHTRDDARHALFDFIEVWYNRERRHSTLGYISPVEYEQRLNAA